VVTTSVLSFGGPGFKTCDTVQLIRLPIVYLRVIFCSRPPDVFSHIKNVQLIENYIILHYLLLMIIDVFLVLLFPYTGVHSSVSSSLPTQAHISSSAPFSHMPSACAFP
jgi:hypothetical protein